MSEKISRQKEYCPQCFLESVFKYMEGDYLRYRCDHCGWMNEKSDFYKIRNVEMSDEKRKIFRRIDNMSSINKTKRSKITEKEWGDEQEVVNKDYCGKILRLKKNHRCSVHYHKIKTETFLILSGVVLIELNENKFILDEGEVLDIYAGQRHRFTGVEDSVIIEFSSHHEDSDSYRDEESKKLSEEEIENMKVYMDEEKNKIDDIRSVNFSDKYGGCLW